MRRILPLLLLLAACGTTQSSRSKSSNDPLPDRIKEQEKDLVVDRKATEFKDKSETPKATDEEKQDFQRIWLYFARNDPRWPLERDRFKRRSEAAAYVLTNALLRYYMDLNFQREKAGKQLGRVKAEIVALGEPAAPYLVRLMIMDKIPAGKDKDGKTLYFLTDDITRGDCEDMLERMGGRAVPELLAALKRDDTGVKGRRLIARTLGGTRDPRAYEPLVKLLRTDESWQVRAGAAYGLGRFGDRRAIGPLTEAVKQDKDPFVVKQAGKARYALQRGKSRG